MDQDLQKKIDEARANGYTDEEIQQFLATKNQSVPSQVPIDRSEEYKGLAQGIGLNVGGDILSTGATAAAVGAGAYGAKKAYDALTASRGAQQAAQQVGQQAAQQVGQQAAQQVGQQAAARATGTTGQQTFSQMTKQLTDPKIVNFENYFPKPVVPEVPATSGPVAPQAQLVGQQAAQQGYMDKASQMVRQVAANKALQNMAKLGGVASLSLFSPELGPMTPQTGRMRGMEINPMTRRPWTREEIQQYEQYPERYDGMLGVQQMRR